MTKQEASEVLSLPESANLDEVRSRFQELYSDYHIRLTNAPTPTLKRVYQRNLESLRTACDTLFPGLVVTAPQDLPSAEPVPGFADSQSPRVQQGSASRAGATATKVARPEPATSSKAVNISIVVAAFLGALALLFGVLWYGATDDRKALEVFLNSSSEEQMSYLTHHDKLSPTLKQSLTLLQNGRLSVCNDSDSAVDVTWVIATYRGQDGAFHTFNSRNYPLQNENGDPVWVKWHIGSNGGRQAFNLTKGSELVWDGSVVSYAMGVHYQDQDYVKGGTWSSVQDGCVHIHY